MEFIKDSRITIKKAGVTKATVTSAYIESLTTIKETDISANYTPCGECTAIIDESAPNISSLLSLSASDYDDLIAVVEVLWSDRQSYDVYGTYYIDSILPDIENHSITVQAYDILYKLGQSQYGGVNVQISDPDTDPTFPTFYDASLDVYADTVSLSAGIDPVSYLADMILIKSHGFILSSTHREAYRQIAEAGAAALFVDDNGVVTFGDVIRSEDDVPDMSIDYSDIVADSLSDTIKSVDVALSLNLYQFYVNEPKKGLSDAKVITIAGYSTKRFRIEYDVYPAIAVEVTCPSSGISLSLLDPVYPDNVVVTVTNTTPNAITSTLTVLGIPISYDAKPYANASTSIKKKAVKIDNPLITKSAAALEVSFINNNIIYGNHRHNMELFGVRAGLLDVIDVAGDYYLTVDRIVTKITGGDYKITVEGYEYHPETVSLNAPEE